MRLAVWPVAPARALARALAAATLPGGHRVVTSVVEAEPHTLRASLDDQTVDLVLLATLDVLRAPDGLAAVPGVGLVGEAGPRRVLVATAALDAIATVGFDPRDTQEAILAQLVLRENYGLAPAFALADLAAPLDNLLATHGAVLASADAVVPEGAYRLDLAREFTDLTLRPMPWGLVVARAGALTPAVAAALADAVAAALPDDDDLRDGGVGAYQLTLDGLALDGLDQYAEYLFETGTLTDIPDAPFAPRTPPAETSGDGAAADSVAPEAPDA